MDVLSGFRLVAPARNDGTIFGIFRIEERWIDVTQDVCCCREDPSDPTRENRVHCAVSAPGNSSAPQMPLADWLASLGPPRDARGRGGEGVEASQRRVVGTKGRHCSHGAVGVGASCGAGQWWVQYSSPRVS